MNNYYNYTSIFILIIVLLIGIYCCWYNLLDCNITNVWLAINIVVLIFLTLLLILMLYCIIIEDIP